MCTRFLPLTLTTPDTRDGVLTFAVFLFSTLYEMVMGTQLKMSYTREQDFAKNLGKPVKQRPKPSQQGHFDPDELTRRLYVVLAERKAQEERRRARAEEARAEEAKLRDARSWTSRHHRDHKDSSKSKDAVPERKSSKTKTSEKISDKHPEKPSHSSSTKSTEKNDSEKPSSTDHQPQQPKSKSPKPAPSKKPSPTQQPSKEPLSEKSETYHHIPQEAAKQFTRTTTVDMMRDSSPGSNLVSKISKQALKYHLTGRHPSAPQPSTGPISEEDQKENFSFSILAETRRNSTGDVLSRAAGSSETRRSMVLVDSLAEALEEADVSADREPLSPREVNEHRVDWTQSDEMKLKPGGTPTTQKKERERGMGGVFNMSTVVRKADSFWMLRGRLGGKGEEEGFERIKGAENADFGSRGGGGGGFFAKFKR